MEFEWIYSQDSLRWASSKRLTNLWQNYSVNLSSSKTGSSSCQCTTTLYGEMEETQKSVRGISYSCELCSQIPAGTLVNFWDLDQRRSVTELTLTRQDGDWDRTAEQMMLNFAGSGSPTSRATSALERGELRNKETGKKSVHFNCSEENIELILRTVISANQLSIYGAAADLCKELSKDSRASGKPDAHEYLESVEIPSELPIADRHTDAEPQGNVLQDNERKFEQRFDANFALMLVWRLSNKDNSSSHSMEKKDQMKWKICREYTLPRD